MKIEYMKIKIEGKLFKWNEKNRGREVRKFQTIEKRKKREKRGKE